MLIQVQHVFISAVLRINTELEKDEKPSGKKSYLKFNMNESLYTTIDRSGMFLSFRTAVV